MKRVELLVDRLEEDLPKAAACLVEIDAARAGELGLRSGDLVTLTSGRARSILARLGQPIDGGQGSGLVRVGRFLRQALRVRVNEPLAVAPAGHVVVVEAVYLRPSFNMDGIPGFSDHLKEVLAQSATPVSEGSVLYLPFPGSQAGTSYTVTRLRNGAGVVGATTEVHIEPPVDVDVAQESQVTFDDVGGLDREIRLVRELIQLPLQMPQLYWTIGIKAPRGLLLYGPPGAGKTHLVRAIANEVQARFYYINGPEIVGTMYGQTEANLRNIFADAARYAPSIVLIDEVDAVVPKRSHVGTQNDVRMVAQLLALMDGLSSLERVVVVGTTNRVEALDPAVRRPGRFDREIYIPAPDDQARLAILRIHTREMALTKAAVDALPAVAAHTYGYVGADLMELCREAGLESLRRAMHGRDALQAFQFSNSSPVVEPGDFSAAMVKIRPSALRESFVTRPRVRFDDLAGVQPIKERLCRVVGYRLRATNGLAEADVRLPSGILLCGPPGTGKTSLVHALANELGCNLIVVSGSDIFSKWLGESEQAMQHVFHLARQVHPCIVLLDPLETIAGLTAFEEVNRTPERVLGQLVSELDAIQNVPGIVVIGATHRLDAVSPLVLESGRFGMPINVPLPDEHARRKILGLYLRSVAFDDIPGEVAVERLVQSTDGLSGARIKALCDELKLLAWERSPSREPDKTSPLAVSGTDIDRVLGDPPSHG